MAFGEIVDSLSGVFFQVENVLSGWKRFDQNSWVPVFGWITKQKPFCLSSLGMGHNVGKNAASVAGCSAMV